MRLAAHVAVTETAALFLQRGENYWVTSTSGVTPEDAHTAALLLPDVLDPGTNEFCCLDAAAGPEAVILLTTAMASRPGFLWMQRFVVEGEDTYAILVLAHPVAKAHPPETTASLLSEIVRQIALRIEARAEKHELQMSRERRALRDRFLVGISSEGAVGQCLLDANGTIVSVSGGLAGELEIDPRSILFRRFEEVFAFEAAFCEEQTNTASEPASSDQQIPWERVYRSACLFRSDTEALTKLEATAVATRMEDGSDGWCVSLAYHGPHLAGGLRARRKFAKILIAEDHPVNQKVIQGMVEKLGLSADVVSTGLEAVHAACQEKYAVILMDYQMPDMDGLEATRFIRSHESRIGRVPIVAVTAFGHEDDRLRCEEAGVDEFMVKPIRIEALAEVLARWVPAAIAAEQELATETTAQTADPVQLELAGAIQQLSADLGSELVQDVVRLFLEDTRVRIAELWEFASAGRRSDLRNTAHKVKGSCGSLGARRLMSACEHLEELSQTGTQEEILAAIEAVSNEFEAVTPFMRARLDAREDSAFEP
ncbi:MAG: response regulator [Bryobacterales bacterium]|nr:response regulator [Bryobacterales bacterium]